MDNSDIQVSNAQLLDNLNLINEGLLTRAAVLLFHHNPENGFRDPMLRLRIFNQNLIFCIKMKFMVPCCRRQTGW